MFAKLRAVSPPLARALDPEGRRSRSEQSVGDLIAIVRRASAR